MPAVSKAQFRFMEAVKHGAFKKKGLSKDKAAEFTDTASYKSLPESTGKWMGGYSDGGYVEEPDGKTQEVGEEYEDSQKDPRDPEMLKLYAEALKKRKKGNL